MDINTCYKVGYILKPHGLKGAVTIAIDPEAPDEFGELESVFVLKNNQLIPHFIESVSLKGDKAFIKFEDVDSHEGAMSVSKCSLYLPKSSRPKSARGEFYDDEILGFEVTDSEAGVLGKIVGITMAGPNKLLTIDCNGKEILIPLNSPFVTGINKSKKKISVELPDGFLDI
jgi:16S rRNA processing protein RimM